MFLDQAIPQPPLNSWTNSTPTVAALLVASSVFSVVETAARIAENETDQSRRHDLFKYSESNLKGLKEYFDDGEEEVGGRRSNESEGGGRGSVVKRTSGGHYNVPHPHEGSRRKTTTKKPGKRPKPHPGSTDMMMTTRHPSTKRTTSTIDSDENEPMTTVTADHSGSGDLTPIDVTWILLCAFIIFTMQTGFGLLEGGIVSPKNETNILMKNVVDVVLGGFTYWIFGYGITYGTWKGSTPFFGIGIYAVDADIAQMGPLFTSFFFQLSFATTATTIVSGALAERCSFKAYCLYSFFATLTYCISARWVWGPTGFLGEMGAIDIAGSGCVHLVGGSSAFVAAWMLGPRLGRYDSGAGPPPVGNNTNALMGLFNLWWGWMAFNAGSTYGMTGNKWKFAARAATSTLVASIGGGLVGLIYGWAKPGKTIEALDVINPILGSLVGVTAGCALLHTPEAFVTGVIGAVIVIGAGFLPDALKIDDPVGATAVHGFGGIWGLLAVGVFAEDDEGVLGVTKGNSGFFRNGSLHLLGVQILTALCIIVWSMMSSFFIFWMINFITPLRVSPEEELMGLDFCEHGVRRSKIGMTPALSLFNSEPEVRKIHKAITGITGQNNPAHDIITDTLKEVKHSHEKLRTKSGRKRTLKGAVMFARAFKKLQAQGNRVTPRKRRYIFSEYMSELKSSSESVADAKKRPLPPLPAAKKMNAYERAKKYFKIGGGRKSNSASEERLKESLENSGKMGLGFEDEKNQRFYTGEVQKKKNNNVEDKKADLIPTYGYLR